MGFHENITAEKFPKQGTFLHRRVMVCYHYDTSKEYKAICIRDDAEEPGLMLFWVLGPETRYLRSTECQYRVLPEIEDVYGDEEKEAGL